MVKDLWCPFLKRTCEGEGCAMHNTHINHDSVSQWMKDYESWAEGHIVKALIDDELKRKSMDLENWLEEGFSSDYCALNNPHNLKQKDDNAHNGVYFYSSKP